ncbi:hypothetical protein K4L44_08005 [Halosquirtibacter laminarini]|uniref:Uncharacterized protein n=1 Tax=Halosquirtibacter laminarini TaxID=3374600 RepID=A0AC61NL84_9BACT|nr:hypothetical protein K4L44_08005 [Prolixibacteraceae bacterium]
MRNAATYCTDQLFDQLLVLKNSLDPFIQQAEMQQLLHLINFIQRDENVLLIDNEADRFLEYAKTQKDSNGFHNLILQTLFNAVATGNGKAELVQNKVSLYDREERLKFSFNESFDSIPKIEMDEILQRWQPYTEGRTICINPKDPLDNDFYSWQSLKELGHPSSSFVLVDNYICAHYNISNLISILEAYLRGQKECHEKLHITIVTSKIYTKGRDSIEPTEISVLKKRIDREIQKSIDKDCYNLNIVLCKTSDNHDRHIFTDYYTFRSGNSFNYFDNQTMEIRLRSMTDLEVIPNTARNKEQLYDSYFENHRLSVRTLIENADDDCVAGGKINRLLGIF